MVELVLEAVILIVVLLVFRPVFLWYWKVNRAVDALERIADKLAPAKKPKERPL